MDCNEVLTPIFETTTGKLFTASLHIIEVKMPISKPELLGYHEGPLEHMEDTESLLYTKAEVKAYDEWIHASRARKAISSALTRRYCTGSGWCGPYQPTEPGTFNLENLVTELESTLDWKQWMMTYLQTGGQYASIFILVVWTLKMMQRLLTVLSIKKQGFGWRTAVMLNFNLESQVRRTILRNVPAPAPAPAPDTEVGETLLLTESNRE